MEIAPLHKEIKTSGLPLERLTQNSRVSEEQKIHEVCGQFEAVLLRQILEKAQKPLFPSHSALNSSVNSIYQDMTTAQLADSISKAGSFGLARNLEEQFARQLAKKTAQDLTTGQSSNLASLP
jgi:Rod binding domain-containing protein